MASLQDPLFAVPVSYLVTGLIAAGARFVLTKEPPTIRKVVEALVLAGAVIFSIYPYLQEKEYSHGIINLTLAVLAFAAKDTLEIILKLWQQVKKDPLSLLRDFLNKIKPDGDS